jgi:hypothetical protein
MCSSRPRRAAHSLGSYDSAARGFHQGRRGQRFTATVLEESCQPMLPPQAKCLGLRAGADGGFLASAIWTLFRQGFGAGEFSDSALNSSIVANAEVPALLMVRYRAQPHGRCPTGNVIPSLLSAERHGRVHSRTPILRPDRGLLALGPSANRKSIKPAKYILFLP